MKRSILSYIFYITTLFTLSILITSCSTPSEKEGKKSPVDYVNPLIGNISHLLVPTYPTVHLPNSMLRVSG